jgi:Dyp-type peroxidase family
MIADWSTPGSRDGGARTMKAEQADVDQAVVPVPDGLPLRSSMEIQGNILAGFKKPHQVFLFLRFGDPGQARQWLRELLDRGIATTAEVATFNDEFRTARARQDPPDLRALWRNVSLTSEGLHKLAPLPLNGDKKRDVIEEGLGRRDYAAFRAGPLGERFRNANDVRKYRDSGGVFQLREREQRRVEDERALTTAELLGDEGRSGPEKWLVGGPGQQPDALLTIASDDEEELHNAVADERRHAEGQGLDVLREQQGAVLPGGTEHFGFKEGVSQPGIVGFTKAVIRNRRWEDAERLGSPVIATGEFVLGWPGERTRDGRPSPGNAPTWMRNGSFQVFRRLTQHVDEWWAKMRHLADASTPSRYLAAKAIGRWPDGAPLAPANDREGDNDFDYRDDDFGYHTPRFAHIRKTNPRNDPVFRDRTHRMLRRGIPFTEEDGERGLLFNAFMANIEYQFEVMQREWANNQHFPSQPFDTLELEEAVVDGPDPITGNGDASCLLRREGQPDRRLDLGEFVHTTGAVYAFAPSMSTLRRLAGNQGAEPRRVEAPG